jgi:hypothetical protein
VLLLLAESPLPHPAFGNPNREGCAAVFFEFERATAVAPVEFRFSPEPPGGSCSSGEPLGGGVGGTERMLVKEVNRGRMYDSVDGCGIGGGGGGVGGFGGGNQVCRESLARSEVTWRCLCRSALEPTM